MNTTNHFILYQILSSIHI